LGFVWSVVDVRPYEIQTAGFATVGLNFFGRDYGHFVTCNRLFDWQ
jgi:hypothetical protein